jgi:RNA polymerase sigma factor (sigma-70 family)
VAAGLDPEALLAEAAWLKRLARTLAGDVDDADDLVQESWITAWRRNPDTSRPLRPWLGKVVRDQSRMRRRAEARRAQRETAASEPQAASAPDELLEQARLHRLLVDLVLELEEPYRSTVLARYVDGQTSAAIAKRLNVAESTVRWRLHEALTRLRTRLDEMNAKQEAWAPGVGGVSAAFGKALLAMKTTKLVVLCIVLVLVAGIAWHWRPTVSRNVEPRRGDKLSAANVPAPATTATPASSTVGAPSVRKLATRELRDQLLLAIRAEHERRISEARTTTRPAPAATAHARPGSADNNEDTDDPDQDYVRDAMRALLPMVVDCYKQARITHPALAGTLVVNFTIEGEPGIGGVVTESAIDPEQSEIKDPDLGQCVEETMFALEIDPPTNGGTVKVSFPFTFRPKE